MNATIQLHELPLPGLREDNPRDFLAALGLIRLMAAISNDGDILLSWSPDGYPSLHLPVNIEEKWSMLLVDLIQEVVLGDDLKEDDRRVHQQWLNEEFSSSSQKFIRNGTHINSLIFGAVPSVGVRNIRKAFQNGLSIADGPRRNLIVSLLCGLVSQVHENIPKDKNPRGNISLFSFANKQGQKYLLFGLQEAVRRSLNFTNLLRDNPEKVENQTFRWSPDEYRPSAYLGGVNNYKDAVESNVAAFFGMSFFPVVDKGDSDRTTGFSKDRKRTNQDNRFTWPIWETPLDVNSIFSLIHMPFLHQDVSPGRAVKAIGCLRVWRCRRFSADKSLYFSPAELLH